MATWQLVRDMLLGIPSYNFILESENIASKLFAASMMRDIPFGLGVMANHLAVKHWQLLEDLDVPEVTRPIIRIAFLADALERALIGQDLY